MGIVDDIRRAGIARLTVGTDRGAGGHVGGDEAAQRCGGHVWDLGDADAARTAVADFDRTGHHISSHRSLEDEPYLTIDKE